MPRTRLLPALGALALGLAFLAPGASSGPLPAEVDLPALSDAFADLGERINRGTVLVQVSRLEEGQRVYGFGSGFVIDAIRGIVVTNHHVVGGAAANVKVVLGDGRTEAAEVVATDPATDVAVVRIPPGFARAQLSWGDSDVLRPGHLVLAVGSPLGMQGTTSVGVVSALGRTLPDLEQIRYMDFLQFDAFIDQGSSGGPLCDMRGRVVGINTAIRSTKSGPGGAWSGYSYAVPSRIARHVVEDLLEHGEVRRGWLGTRVEPVRAGDAELLGLLRPYGVSIQEVVAGSPAERAGLRKGDVILAIEGREVPGVGPFLARIATYPPEAELELRVWRRKKPLEVTVVLGERAGG